MNIKIDFLKLIQQACTNKEIIAGKSIYISLGLLLIFSLSYFFWFGNGLFFYQENSMLFIFYGEYLRKYLMSPGGLLEYIGNFITQGYFSRIYGSLVITLFLLIFGGLFIRVYKLLETGKSVWLFPVLIPSCLLFLMQIRVDHYIFHTLGYILVTIYLLISIIFEKRRLNVLTLVLFPLFFYITGSFALIFLIGYLSYCLLYKRGTSRYLLPGSLILTSFFTFFLFEKVLFLQPAGHIIRYPLSIFETARLYAGDSILCSYIIFFPLIVRITGFLKSDKRFSILFSQISLVIVLSFTLLLSKNLYDAEFADYIQIEKLYCEQEWDKIILQHEQIPSKSLTGQYFYNLALTEKGQLCDRMFFGNQDYGAKSLVLPRESEYINRSVYFYYAVGFINEAHHLAYESMVKYGYRPENIKMLAKTEIINGNYKSAERYLGVLKKTFHYREWADRYIRMLYEPAIILSDPDLGEKIQLQPRRDFFISQNDAANIDFMLLANPDNKRAFEYKMAWFLLEKDYKSVVYQVKRMKDMNYQGVPRHIGEAIILFIDSKQELPYLGDFAIGSETENRFIQFKETLEMSENEAEFKKIMDTSLGKTFWYYYEFK